MLSTQLGLVKARIQAMPKESWTSTHQDLMQMINHVDKMDDLITEAHMAGGLHELSRIILMPSSLTCPTCSHELVNCEQCGRTTKKP